MIENKQVYETNSGLSREVEIFERVHSVIEINPEDIKGRVLVAGCSILFPERIWLCNKENKRQLSPAIKQLICIDDNLYTNPLKRLFDETTRVVNDSSVDELDEEDGHIFFANAELSDILSNSSKKFNLITFCRIPNLTDQLLAKRLFIKIVDKLETGGLAILSGSSKGEGIYLEEALERIDEKLGRKIQIQFKATKIEPNLYNCSNGKQIMLAIKRLAEE